MPCTCNNNCLLVTIPIAFSGLSLTDPEPVTPGYDGFSEDTVILVGTSLKNKINKRAIFPFADGKDITELPGKDVTICLNFDLAADKFLKMLQHMILLLKGVKL